MGSITPTTPTQAWSRIMGIAKGGRGCFPIDLRTKFWGTLTASVARTGTTALTAGLGIRAVPKYDADPVGPLTAAPWNSYVSQIAAAVSTTVAAKPAWEPAPAAGDIVAGVASSASFAALDYMALCEARAVFADADFVYLQDDGGVFTDYTAPEAADAGANDVVTWPATPALNDAIYLGAVDKFPLVEFNVGTAGVAVVGEFVWEYYNGATWSAFIPQGDETGYFGVVSTGARFLGIPFLSDWATVAVNSITRYWIRCRCLAYTSKTAFPIITQAWGYDAQRFELEAVSRVITAGLYSVEPLKYAHTVAQADRVTNKSDLWVMELPGGRYYNIYLDYGASTTGEGLIVGMTLQTQDSMTTA